MIASTSMDLASDPKEITAHGYAAEVFRPYFLLTYLALLVNTGSYLKQVSFSGFGTALFAVAVYLTYTLLYLLPVLLLILAVSWMAHAARQRGWLPCSPRAVRWIVYALAVVGCTLLQYLIFADKSVFAVFGFHLNGFVWNLVFTKGGIDSMGGGEGTTLAAVLVGVAFAALQLVLLLVVVRFGALRRALARFLSRRSIVLGAAALLLMNVSAQLDYGISSLRGDGAILAAADAFPCFLPTTFARIARSFGYEPTRTPSLALDSDSGRLNYPRQRIHRDEAVEPLNIVWLVTESLRADMLDPEIMPNAWALSEKAARFERHYSGGNGTRMGMFTMFYGLYGPYWFSVLAENRGPVLVDTLIDAGYQMDWCTSAMFTYPEFDKTILARIPSEQIHQGGGKPSWKQDQHHIDSMLRFIDRRDPSRPFFTFEFFEAPHANYSFSDRSVIRRPFAQTLNYVTMDLEHDIGLIKNRYINACREVDGEIGRILTYLKEHDLMDSTIVLITGDHGEAFMEHGRWGHNSGYTEEETRVPFVLWVPGMSPRVVTRLTSHLDVPATMMKLLGVTNPPTDFSQGYDLLGDTVRPFTVISEWNDLAYVDQDFKAAFPTSAFAVFRQDVTTAADVPLQDPAAFYESHQRQIVELMRGLKKFHR